MPELGSAYYRLSTDPTAFNAGLTAAEARANTSAARISRSFKRIGRNITKAGHLMTKAFTVPALAIGGAAVFMNLKFEDALTKIDALVGASDKQMQAYRESILALGRDSVVGPQKLAESLYFITSSGFKGAAAMKVLTSVNKAANAGMDDVSATADLLTSAINVYGKKALSAADATDILLAGVREGKAEPNALASSMGRVLGVAQALKVPFEDLTGIVASFTLKGYSADEAVTAVRGAMRVLIKPASTAKDALEKVGLSIGGLRKQVEREGIAKTLITMRNAFKGNVSEMAKVIPNSSTLSAVLSVTAGKGKQLMKVMNGVKDSTGAAAEAAAEASKDPMTQIRKAWSSIRVDLIELGAILVPFVAKFIGWIQRLAKWFTGLSDRWKKIILIAVAFLAIMGPILLIVGALVTAIAVLIPVFAGVGGVIALAVIAIAALAAGFIYLYKKFAFVRKHWQLFLLGFSVLFVVVITIVKFLMRNWDKIVDITVNTFNAIKDAVVNTATAIYDFIVMIFTSVVNFFREWGTTILSIILLPLLIILKIWTDILNRLIGIVRAVWGKIGGTIIGAMRRIVGFVRAGLNLIRSVVTSIWNRVRAITSAVWGALSGIVGRAATAIYNALKGPVGRVLGFVKGVFEDVRSFLSGWVSKAKTVAGKIGSGIYDGVSGVLGGLASHVGGLVRSAINAVIDAFNALTEFKIDPPGPGSFSVNIPDVPHVARGGVVTRNTLANIGEGNRKEAILPLESRRGTDFMARAMERAGGGSNRDLRGLRIAGTLDIDTGELRGTIIDVVEAHDAWKERRG